MGRWFKSIWGRNENNLKENGYGLVSVIEMRECPYHGLTEYVKRKDGRFRCKKCALEVVSNKRRRNKVALVEYKGGKCEICGYDKCIEALSFHHLDPNQKDFGVSNGNIKSLETLKREADKCILVCHNCHAELHAKQREEIRLEEERLREENLRLYEEKHGKMLVKTKLSSLKEEMLKLVNQGDKQKEIAQTLNVSLSSLKKYFQRNHIETLHAKSHLVLTKEILIEDFKNLKSFCIC